MRFAHGRADPLAGQTQLVRVVGFSALLACLAVPLTEYWGAQRNSGSHEGQQLQLLAAAVDSEQTSGEWEGSQGRQHSQELASLQERLRVLEASAASAEEQAKEGEERAQELAALTAQVTTELEAAKAAAEQRANEAAQHPHLQPSLHSSSLSEESCSQPALPVNEGQLATRNSKYGYHCKLVRDACLDQGRIIVHSGVKTPGHPDFQDEVFKLDEIPPALLLPGYPEPAGKAHYMPVSSFQLDIRAPSSLDPPDVRTPAAFNNCTVPLVFAPHYHTIFADFILWRLNTLGKMAARGVYDYESVQFVVDSNGMDLPPFYAQMLRPFSKQTPLSLAAISSRVRSAEGHSRCYSQMLLCDLKFMGMPKVVTRKVMEWYKKLHPDKFVAPANDNVFRVTFLEREGKYRQITNQEELLEQCKRWQPSAGSSFTRVECSTLSDFSPQNFLSNMAQVERTHALGATGEVVALRMALPHSFDELRAVRRTLELYRVHYGPQLVQLMTGAYLFLQAFMTPGCVAINILMGSMYSFWVAFIYVGVVSTIGASLNYCLVRLLLKDVVSNVLPGRVAAFSKEVRRHQAHLLNYMLFIRATPILPGWFVNLASPIVGVPYPVFLIATFVGHQPLNFFTVEAGVALSTIHSMRDLYSPRNVAFMLLVGMAFLVPVFFKWRRQHRRKGDSSGGGGGGVQARAVNILVGPGESPHQH